MNRWNQCSHQSQWRVSRWYSVLISEQVIQCSNEWAGYSVFNKVISRRCGCDQGNRAKPNATKDWGVSRWVIFNVGKCGSEEIRMCVIWCCLEFIPTVLNWLEDNLPIYWSKLEVILWECVYAERVWMWATLYMADVWKLEMMFYWVQPSVW